MSDNEDDKGKGDAQGDETNAERTSRAQKLGRFAKEHPGTALMAAAGVGALLGGELGVGALLGVGATLLVTKKRDGDLPAQARQLLGATQGQLRQWLGSTKDFARRMLPHAQTDETGATPPA